VPKKKGCYNVFMFSGILFWGITISMIGKVLLGVTVMMVHWKVVKEHKIDRVVLKEMRRERNLAFLGILFILVGYYLELVGNGILPLL
jgi:MFS superfamily sulfate permease-like transporter